MRTMHGVRWTSSTPYAFFTSKEVADAECDKRNEAEMRRTDPEGGQAAWNVIEVPLFDNADEYNAHEREKKLAALRERLGADGVAFLKEVGTEAL